jgi:hypothetical protein
MILLLDILGGRIHFFCRTQLVDNFGGTSLAWASMGLQAHKVGFQGPTCHITEIFLWRLTWHHEGPNLAPTTETFCLKESKRHFVEVDLIEGLGFGGDGVST